LNKKLYLIIIIIISIFAPYSIFSSPISFSGGYTTLSMKEGNQKITLNSNAKVELETLEIKADKIELSGENYNDIECNGNISFIDKENQITIRCSTLKYNQREETLIIDSWVEINDLKNSIYATAGYLEYDLKNSIIDLLVEVKLLHASEEDVMKCNCDILRFNLKDNNFSMLGNSEVNWKGDSYKAQAITINLNNNDISMDGSIEANINTN